MLMKSTFGSLPLPFAFPGAEAYEVFVVVLQQGLDPIFAPCDSPSDREREGSTPLERHIKREPIDVMACSIGGIAILETHLEGTGLPSTGPWVMSDISESAEVIGFFSEIRNGVLKCDLP